MASLSVSAASFSTLTDSRRAGGAPKYVFPLTMALDQPNITRDACSSLLNALHSSGSTSTKVILLSTNGLSDHTHHTLPFLWRWLYYFLDLAHIDKAGMEILAEKASRSPLYESKDGIDLAPSAWLLKAMESPSKDELLDRIPADFLTKAPLIVQPAILNDSEEKGVQKVRAAQHLTSAWFISRKDVGAWIAAEIKDGKDAAGPMVLAY